MGLLPFRTEDDRLFFGQHEVVAAMLERLAHGSFLVLVGASGRGKSSLLRAGLVARLQRGRDPEREPWLTVVCTPTARPLAELAARLAPLCGQGAAALLHDLEADPRALDVALRQALGSRPEGTRLALVVDQLEELFTQCHEEDERTTLAQDDLPKDTEVLRTLARQNRLDVAGGLYPCAGVYATVESKGTVRPGDSVSLV
jgi:energy-coupling factor transporter ATP-binding protein EcfA2